MTYSVSALYKFVAIADPADLRARLERFCRDNQIIGTILLAQEGINGTVAGTDAAITALETWLRNDPRFSDLTTKRSTATEAPFKRLKVKIKREIVTLGADGADPTKSAGTYVKPLDWNALIADPDVTIIDTRNAYEVTVGTFPGALDPGTRSFNQFPDYVASHLDPKTHRKIAMFCTGGIRCEKASAYLLSQGFEEVFHLEGGILKYLEDVPAEQSLWQGECFVFDERVALQQGLEEGQHALCAVCGQPVSLTAASNNNRGTDAASNGNLDQSLHSPLCCGRCHGSGGPSR